MAERNSGLSNLGHNHFRGPSMGRGWEEAGAEFYQEFHGTMSSSGDDDRHNTMWETMLPSKQVNTIDTRTWGRTTNRRLQSKFGVRKNSASAADLEMETMPDLAQGFADEEETWNQLQQIRSLPVNMASKRELKAKIMHTPRFRIHGLAAFQLRRRQIWHQFRRSVAQFLSHFTLWRSSLHNIEANFGTGVGSYFLLMRWLFLLNVAIAAFIAIFIILPWEIGQNSCPNLKQNQSTCSNPLLQSCNRTESASCDTDSNWLNYTSSVIQSIENRSSTDLFVQDMLQGTGWMEITLIFYGYYQPALLQWREYYYDIGVGYQLTIFWVLILSLCCMANSVAQGFKENINLGKNWLHRYSDLAFASWDYCIDKGRVADLNRKAILNAVRTALADDQYAEEKQSRTIRVKIRLFVLRLVVNSTVIGVLGVSGYIIYLVTYYSQKDEKLIESTKLAYIFEPLNEFLPSIVITTLNFVVPKLFRKFVAWERFSATFELKVTLIRTVLLRLSSLLILIGTLVGNTGLPHRCWETHVGQQLYRLCVFDAAVTIATNLLIQLPMTLACRRVVSKTGVCDCITRPEFDLVGSILDLAYGQAICWMGVVYCPIIPVVTAAKFFLVYYIKYLNLVVCSSAPSRLYGASSSTSLFMNVLLLSFITCVLPLGYHITALEPSRECGPYRGLPTVWALIAEEVSKLGSGVEILKFFGTAGFFVPLILVLIVVLYYYRTKASAQRQLTDALKQQLILEGQDKQFLLNRLASLSKQQSLPN